METLFLSMKQITKVYAGVRALDGVDFSIARGEIHCLAGTNGSGKSTLVKIISGVVAPEAGAEIIMDGELLDQHTSRTAISHGVEVIYQDLSLFPNLTVAENIAVSSNIAQRRYLMDWKRAETTATKAMNRIGISIPLDARVGELSMADQQLVAICRALTGDVRLLIMDEPTTALTKKEIDALLRVVIELKIRGLPACLLVINLTK